jgi:hypothetical protein
MSVISDICRKFKIPWELQNIIHTYSTNDYSYNWLNEHIENVSTFQDFYDDFVLVTYINPKCYCLGLPSKYECSFCTLFEYSDVYKTQSYNTFIANNTQLCKIISRKFENFRK